MSLITIISILLILLIIFVLLLMMLYEYSKCLSFYDSIVILGESGEMVNNLISLKQKDVLQNSNNATNDFYYQYFYYNVPIIISQDKITSQLVLMENYNTQWSIDQNSIANNTPDSIKILKMGINFVDLNIQRQLRDKFNNHFMYQNLKGMTSNITYNIKLFMNLMINKLGIFNINSFVDNLAFDIIGGLTFGIKMNSLISESELSGAIKAYVTQYYNKKNQFNLDQYTINKSYDTIVNNQKNLIIKSKNRRNPKTFTNNNSIFDIFVNPKINLNFTGIISNSLNMIILGCPTLASLLKWSIYQLGTHESQQEKIRNEINHFYPTLESDDNQDEIFNRIKNIHTLDNFINEVLRFNTIVRCIKRISTINDAEIGGYLIGSGFKLQIDIHGMSTNHEYWKDSEQFMPARFNNKFDRSVYIPFGSGPKMCIAKDLTMVIAKLFLIQFLKFQKVKSNEEIQSIPLDSTQLNNPTELNVELMPVADSEQIVNFEKIDDDLDKQAPDFAQQVEAMDLKVRLNDIIFSDHIEIHEDSKQKFSLLLLYASQGGTAQKYVEQVKHEFEEQVNTTIYTFDDQYVKLVGPNYEKGNMIEFVEKFCDVKDIVVIITSTYGDGESPDNGRNFEKCVNLVLSGTNVSKIKSNNKFEYLLMGLGDSSQDKQNNFAKKIDKMLHSIGHKPIIPSVQRDKQDANCEKISEQFVQSTVEKLLGIQSRDKAVKYNIDGKYYTFESQPIKIDYKLEYLDPTSPITLDPLSVDNINQRIFPTSQQGTLSNTMELCKNVEQHLAECKSVFHTEIQESKFMQAEGDHVCILPANPQEIVDEVARALSLGDIKRVFRISTPDKANIFPNPCSQSKALTQFTDFNISPSKKFILKCAEQSDTAMIKSVLLELGSVYSESYDQQVQAGYSCLDFIKEFGKNVKCKNPIELLLLMPRMTQRTFSIASSPADSPSTIKLCITNIKSKNPNNNKYTYGVLSQQLELKHSSQVFQNVRESKFRITSEINPIIAFCIGTGLAPILSFLDKYNFERKNGRKSPPFHLYMGIRNNDDQLQDTKLKDMLSLGTITNMYIARSRVKNKQYVQDLIKGNMDTLFDLIQNQKSTIVICGNNSFSNGVTDLLRLVLVKKCNQNENVDQYIYNMKKENRIIIDAWG